MRSSSPAKDLAAAPRAGVPKVGVARGACWPLTAPLMANYRPGATFAHPHLGGLRLRSVETENVGGETIQVLVLDIMQTRNGILKIPASKFTLATVAADEAAALEMRGPSPWYGSNSSQRQRLARGLVSAHLTMRAHKLRRERALELQG